LEKFLLTSVKSKDFYTVQYVILNIPRFKSKIDNQERLLELFSDMLYSKNKFS